MIIKVINTFYSITQTKEKFNLALTVKCGIYCSVMESIFPSERQKVFLVKQRHKDGASKPLLPTVWL